jgi:hypothetical protein
MNGAERIAAERRRQIEAEGWTPEHDDQHSDGVLALAAGQLVKNAVDAWFKNTWVGEMALKHRGDRIRQLEIAGALIAAEIDRLLRLEQTR